MDLKSPRANARIQASMIECHAQHSEIVDVGFVVLAEKIIIFLQTMKWVPLTGVLRSASGTAIYGSSAWYCEAIDSMLMSDWNHRRALTAFYKELGEWLGTFTDDKSLIDQ
ncbi:hypothetical protein NHQ30_005140 [Ciborinia camelliae]|nr:hypothetical protein NHQ30_005140 [Ciborinia camelliae]